MGLSAFQAAKERSNKMLNFKHSRSPLPVATSHLKYVKRRGFGVNRDTHTSTPAPTPGQTPLHYTLRSGVRVAGSLHQNGTGPYSANSLGLVKEVWMRISWISGVVRLSWLWLCQPQPLDESLGQSPWPQAAHRNPRITRNECQETPSSA